MDRRTPGACDDEAGVFMRSLQANGELLKRVKNEFARASSFYLATALITKSGLDLLYSAIDEALARGCHGSVLFGVDLPSDPQAIETLCDIQRQYKDSLELRRFQSGKTFFHPKLSVFVHPGGGETAIIGSSNLTGGGLDTNYETNVLVDDRKVVRQFLDYYKEHFRGAHARQVDQRWLNQYRKLWAERARADQRQRVLREKARHLGGPPQGLPKGIRGTSSRSRERSPTGRAIGLYPYVRHHGGRIASNAGAMGSAECLVQGEILGGQQSTRKLERARELNIPIITEEMFFQLPLR